MIRRPQASARVAMRRSPLMPWFPPRRASGWTMSYAPCARCSRSSHQVGVCSPPAIKVSTAEAIWDRVQALAGYLRRALANVHGVIVRDIGALQCGIVTFTVDGMAAEAVKARLARDNINVTVTTSFGTRLDMQARGLTQMVRASVHYYNTEDEIARTI